MSNIEEEGDKTVSLPVFTGSRSELDHRLRETASALQIEIPNECWGPVADYCCQLWDWNSRVNLTRHTTPELFVKRDLLDSWHVCKLLEQNEEILDVGTGSGVPGVLIAILRPYTQVTLCDSVAKKAKVVEQIVDKLQLKIPVYGQSVQKVLDDFRYDTLTSRAVGPLVRLVLALIFLQWHTFVVCLQSKVRSGQRNAAKRDIEGC